MIGITGATGFIGGHLVDALQELGVNHRIITRDSRSLKGIDLLIHLAGRSQPPDKQMFRDNVSYTKKILGMAEESGVKKIIFLSTVVVYGSSERSLTEESKPYPTTEYGKTKLDAERLVVDWAKRNKREYIILRPFNIYGPRNTKGVIYSFYKSLKEDGRVVVYGSGKQKRDFLYIGDLIEALVGATKYPHSGLFNIVSDTQVSLVEILGYFEDILDKKVDVKYDKEDTSKPTTIVASGSKARKELGWLPKVDLKDGLYRTIKSYDQGFSN